MVVFIIPSGFFFFSSSSTSSGPLETSVRARLLLTHSSGDCWATQVVTTSTPTHIAGRFLLHPFSPHFFFLFRLLFKKRLANRPTPRAPTSLSPRNSRLAKQANKSLLKENISRQKQNKRAFMVFAFLVLLYFILFLALLPNRKVHNEVAESRGRPYPIPATGNVISILG
jgi:hypothetical protein